MALSVSDQRSLLALGGMLAGIFLIHRSFAKKTPTGDVVIGPVTVTPSPMTPADQAAAVLADLQRRAGLALGVDPDTMQPTRHPTALEQDEIQQTIAALRAANQNATADYLQGLLNEADTLPIS